MFGFLRKRVKAPPLVVKYTCNDSEDVSNVIIDVSKHHTIIVDVEQLTEYELKLLLRMFTEKRLTIVVRDSNDPAP
jgi:hypothetical protein